MVLYFAPSLIAKNTLQELVQPFIDNDDVALFDLKIIDTDVSEYDYTMPYYLYIGCPLTTLRTLFPQGGQMHVELRKRFCDTPDDKYSHLFNILRFSYTPTLDVEKFLYFGGTPEVIAEHTAKYWQKFRNSTLFPYDKPKLWDSFLKIKRLRDVVKEEMAVRIQRCWRKNTSSPCGIRYQRLLRKYAFRRHFFLNKKWIKLLDQKTVNDHKHNSSDQRIEE